MSIVRYVLAAGVVVTMATAAGGVFAIAEPNVHDPAPAPTQAFQDPPAARIVPALAGAGLDQAVSGALGATRKAVAAQKRSDERKKADRESAVAAPKLTCEPGADARLVGDMIVNKACPGLNALKETSQREYAQQQADEAAGYPLGGADALESERAANAGEDSGKSSGELQFEYGCQQGYIPAGEC